MGTDTHSMHGEGAHNTASGSHTLARRELFSVWLLFAVRAALGAQGIP